MGQTNKSIYRVIRGGPELISDTENLIPLAEVNIFPWGDQNDTKDRRPYTTAQMACLPDCLFIKMTTYEQDPRTYERGFSNQVYTDSCMELFLMPDPGHSDKYFNWEFNSASAMYLSLGSDRFDRTDIVPEQYSRLFCVETEKPTKEWSVMYRIPHGFIQGYFPDFKPDKGWKMRGNFYKCGEKTPSPHYGCWTHIDLPRPDFHSPSFFGEIIID